MSTLREHSVKPSKVKAEAAKSKVTNFMGGNSYTLNPLDSLKLIAMSSIFGEPSYYRDSGLNNNMYDAFVTQHLVFPELYKEQKSTVDIFTNAIDASLDFDYNGTIEFAVELRNDFFMRLNPSVIFVRAVMHPGRIEFTEKTGSKFSTLMGNVILRPDDITNMFDYFMYLNGSKNGLPSVMKRTWAKKLGSFTRYQMAKYKCKSLLDLVRISHPKSNDILAEFVKTGTVKVDDSELTWEKLRSEGKTWKEIFETTYIPHMAVLKNLRGIFSELDDNKDRVLGTKILAQLKASVAKAKQFPYAYLSAYKAVEADYKVSMKARVLEALDVCVNESIKNFPKLKGRTACISDNSGSAWGAMATQMGSMQIAEIGNLSSVLACFASEDGEVNVIGDKCITVDINKSKGIFENLKEVTKKGKSVGMGTENGIWLFFDKAIKNKIHYDNILIYSDMQAGHGGLYGTDSRKYSKYSCKGGRYIDVLALVEEYRKKVNPKVNIMTTQTAGYNNNLLPENLYRGCIMAGWTGKEIKYLAEMSAFWDDIDTNQK